MAKQTMGVALLLSVGCLLATPVFSQPVATPGGKRTPSSQVGAVMTLLATFEDAGVLPAEKSPDANRIIKALIQFQSALVKSEHPAIRALFQTALTAKFGEAAPTVIATFRSNGWTSETLEAVVDYAAARPIWTHPGIVEGFRAYNVGQSDFTLLARIFTEARAVYAGKGQSIHDAAAAHRKEMPGKKQKMPDEL
ncbi:MAG: hypothetical protein ACKOBZ_02440 [Nitrospira sp.]